MIERRLLRYFLAVVDHGSFSAAARHCSVSQPSLSIGITRLEDLVGSQVFKRTNRRVELTPAGARLVTPARRVEAEFCEAERAALDVVPVTTVRVGLMTTLPAAWAQAALSVGSGTDGERLEVVDARARDLPALLDRGRVDAGIGLLPNDRHPGRALWSERYALALPMGHKFAERQEIRAEEVASENMFARRDCEALALISRHFTSRGIRPFMAARPLNDERALAYVRAGLGITLMPMCYGHQNVALVPVVGFTHVRTVGIVFHPGKPDLLARSQALAQIVDVLLSLAEASDGIDLSPNVA